MINYEVILIEILTLLKYSDIINFSIINKTTYIFFINNKNYIGINILKRI